MFTIATWNVNSLRVRLPQVLEWLVAEKPDALALQETKLTDDAFPVDEFQQIGYGALYSGQKTYNGMAIVSRQPARDSLTDIPELDDPQRRLLVATVGGLRIANVYVPNGQEAGSEKFAYKLTWLEKLTDLVRAEAARHPRFALLGDFNIAPSDADVHDPAEWEGQVLCSEPERAAFRRLLDTGLEDSFRLFEQPEREYSWWDYRMNAFRRKRGLRIDHILVSGVLAKACTSCRIDIEPRRRERPSDHAPVVAAFADA